MMKTSYFAYKIILRETSMPFEKFLVHYVRKLR